MVKATGDRWSYYIPAAEYEAYREQTENAYVGVGMTIQATEDDSGFLIVDGEASKKVMRKLHAEGKAARAKNHAEAQGQQELTGFREITGEDAGKGLPF